MTSARAGEFRLSRDELPMAREILSCRLGRGAGVDELAFDSYSDYWREMLRVLHGQGGRGAGETIAVLDSGCAEDVARECGVVKTIDLTGEGAATSSEHGTAIAALLHLVAPDARQVHVKLYDRRETIPGDTYAGQVELVERAFKLAREAGATVVNLSWTYLTTLERHRPRDVRPGHFCRCPICSVVTQFVRKTDAEVFVAEGNFHYADGHILTIGHRPTGAWSCPAAAALAVPVLGYRDGRPWYNSNLDTTCAVPAPAEVCLRSAPEMSVSGSSFATPLVAATLAATRSAFRAAGFGRIALPRNEETEGHASTGYNFALDGLFVPPDPTNWSPNDPHAQWYVLIVNCHNQAQRLEREGRHADAARLCSLAAELVSVPYARLNRWPWRPDIGAMAAHLHLAGIQYLCRAGDTEAAKASIPRARDALTALAARGQGMPDAEQLLHSIETGLHLEFG